MRVLVIVKANAAVERGGLPTEQELREMGRFNDELIKAGVMLAGEGLHPSARGARLRFSGDERTVTRGPFSSPESLVAGYWLVQVKSLDEALEWFKHAPFREGELELRQVMEEADFGDIVNKVPEVFEAERAFRDKQSPRH